VTALALLRLLPGTAHIKGGQVFEEAGVYELFKRPLNPYSQGLLNANPSHGQPGEPLQIIPGRVPAPEAWPKGCRFAPRCAFAEAECRVGAIPLLEPAKERFSRCIRIDELMRQEVL
jgi:peptide/nickel transport system permease protein